LEVAVTEDTDLGEVAELLEAKRIKRVPVIRDGKVVGISQATCPCFRINKDVVGASNGSGRRSVHKFWPTPS
jgi:predicted transcriptional regulator